MASGQIFIGDRRKADPIMRAVLIAALVGALAWAARPLVPVSEARFEADSTRRDRNELRRDSILNRIDSRTGEMYCGRLPDSLRAGCR